MLASPYHIYWYAFPRNSYFYPTLTQIMRKNSLPQYHMMSKGQIGRYASDKDKEQFAIDLTCVRLHAILTV